MRLLIISIKTAVTAYPFKLFSPRSGPYPFRYIMAKHYKKYNADNKNKSQNIIKKTFMPPRDYATASRFSKLYVYRKSTTIKSHRHRHYCAPIRKFYCASAIHDAHDAEHTHHTHNTITTEHPTAPPPRTQRHPIPRKSAHTTHHTKTKPPTTTTHHHSPTPHTQRQKKHQNARHTPKKAQKMAEIRHFLTINRPSRLLSRPTSGCFYGIICNF